MKRLVIIWLTCLLGACTDAALSERQSQANPADSQERRADAVRAFTRDREQAISTYRQKWWDEMARSPPTVEAVAIAGELMAADPASYQAYYGYLLSALSSPDETITLAVLGAFSHAKGRESLEILVGHATSDQQILALAAMTALNYRMTTAEFDPAQRSDLEYLQMSLPVLCRAVNSRPIEQYCQNAH
jgi:hypothetical protein